jgi:signal transduction histidine kinase
MRSLRARIFLTVWPLFVVAILAVGALSSRSARLELAQFERRAPPAQDGALITQLADSVVAHWPALQTREGPRTLRRFAVQTADSLELLVLDGTGALIASSDSSLTADAIALRPDGSIELRRSFENGRERQLQRLLLSGTALISRDSVRRGALYQFPGALPRPSRAETMVAGIQRSLWLAVLLACGLAGIGTWVLAYPLVAQVQRLTAAASGVQAKALSTRVRVSSRDELGTLEQSFNRMAASLEQNEVAKRQLISDVAHELRTPLTNVIGLLEAMRDGLKSPDAATLSATQSEAQLLKQLIDELQELSLADAGGLTFAMGELDARFAVQQAVEAFQAAVPAIDVRLSDAALIVRADPRRVAQVLRNVLQNAVTHTPADGRVTLSLHRDGSWAVITVADTGRGIAPEHLPLIWERFYRVDPSRDRSTGGMGLGLALTKRMVEGMGGTIAASSTVGVGTTITIRLSTAVGTT